MDQPGPLVRYGVTLLHAALAIVFLYAGAIKLLDASQFLVDVTNYRVLGYEVAQWVAVFLPWLEVFVGVGLLTSRFREGALWLAGGLLVIFEALVLSSLYRGLDVRCGCFGSGSALGGLWPTALRNVVLLAMIVSVLIHWHGVASDDVVVESPPVDARLAGLVQDVKG